MRKSVIMGVKEVGRALRQGCSPTRSASCIAALVDVNQAKRDGFEDIGPALGLPVAGE